MKKKGFTLVELLAVIAILAILVIIALPNVIGMFNSAKKNSFVTECKEIYKLAQQKYVNDSLFETDERIYAKCETEECPNQLDLSGRSNIYYYVRFDKSGAVKEMHVTDGDYQFSYLGSGLAITDITDADLIADLLSEEIFTITCISAEAGEASETDAVAMFDRGSVVNIKMKVLAGIDSTGVAYEDIRTLVDENVRAILKSNTEPTDENKTEEHIVSTSDSAYPIYMWYDNGTIYWWSEAKKPYLNPTSDGMFMRFKNLSDISGLSYFNASKVETMKSTFRELDSIQNINALSSWRTPNLTSLYATFYKSCVLTTDPLRYWNTSKVTNMEYTFYQSVDLPCLTSLNGLANWNTSSVTSLRATFTNTYALLSLHGLENWDTSNVTSMYFTFGMTASQDKIGNPLFDASPLRNWDTSKVETMGAMFQNVNIISYEPFANWDVSKVTVFQNTFNATRYSQVTTLHGLENWDVSSATDVGLMFYQNVNLTDASAINNWEIGNVTNFTKFFGVTPAKPTFTKLSGTFDSEGTFVPN